MSVTYTSTSSKSKHKIAGTLQVGSSRGAVGGLSQHDARKLGRWTRYHGYCSCRCSDLDKLVSTNVQGDGSPLYWFQNYPCRRLEIVGLIIGVKERDDSVTYDVDDGTGIVVCKVVLPPSMAIRAPDPQADELSLSKQQGKRPIDDDEDTGPSRASFRLGQLVRVLGTVEQRGTDRALIVKDMTRQHLSAELEHARKAKLLRQTTYAEPFEAILEAHRKLLDQEPIEQHDHDDMSPEATNARIAAMWAKAKAPEPASGSQRSIASAHPSSELDYFVDEDRTPRAKKRTLSMSQAASTQESMMSDGASYAEHTVSSQAMASQSRTGSNKLNAPHKIPDSKLSSTTFFDYLDDYFHRHNYEAVSWDKLWASKTFRPLAARIVEKVAAEPTPTDGRVAIQDMIRAIKTNRRYSLEAAVKCLYRRTLNDLVRAGVIAATLSLEESWQYICAGTLRSSVCALLRQGPRCTDELFPLLRRSDERWQFAGQKTVEDALLKLKGEGAITMLHSGRWGVCA